MFSPFKRQLFAMLLATSTMFAACADEASEDNNSSNNTSNNTNSNNTNSNNTQSQKLSTGQGPCEAASECKGDVCVSLIDGNNPPIYCTQTCDNSQCPQGFVCDEQLFSLVGLSFCRFAPKDQTPGEDPAPPEEPPTLPCKTDKDCDMGQVCASYGGERACSLPCSQESDCTPPSVGGITMDLLTCAKDDDQRDVCLPDPACFPNPTTCIDGFPGIPGF